MPETNIKEQQVVYCSVFQKEMYFGCFPLPFQIVQVIINFSWIFYLKRKKTPNNGLLSLIWVDHPRLHQGSIFIFFSSSSFSKWCGYPECGFYIRKYSTCCIWSLEWDFETFSSVTEGCQKMWEKHPSVRSKLVILTKILILHLDSPNLIKITFMDPRSLWFFLFWIFDPSNW